MRGDAEKQEEYDKKARRTGGTDVKLTRVEGLV